MPTEDTATLIISARADTTGINKYITAVESAENASNHFLKTLGNLFSAGAMARWTRESVNLFARQESAVEGLRSAFRRLGTSHDAATRELMNFNKEMQASTIYGDEMLAAVEAQGLNMGITTGKIKEATKAAIGLAAAYNMQLSTAMMLIARASQGQTQMLSRYGIVLGENLTPQEKYAQLLEYGTRNMGLAEDKAKTLSGAIQQMSNAYGDAREKVGEQFAPAIRGVAGTIKSLSEGFSNLSPEWQRFIVLTGTLTTGMVALKGIMSLNTVVQHLSGAASAAASEKKKAALAQEIQLEKALQKEKLANIALTQAQGDVAMARKDLAKAQAEQQAALRSPNLDAIAAADAKVAAASAKLAEYEKVLKKTEEAHIKAANAASVFGAANTQTADILNKRKELVASVNTAEQAEVRVKRALTKANEELAAAENRLAEAKRQNDIAGARYTRVAASGAEADTPEFKSAYNASQVAGSFFQSKQAEYTQARDKVAAYVQQLEVIKQQANESKDALKAFDDARAKEENYVKTLKQNVAAQEARTKVLKKGGDALKAHEAATKAYNKVLAAEAADARLVEQAEQMKNQALRMGATEAEATMVAETFLNKERALAIQRTKLLGRAQLALARNLRVAAAAAKSLVRSLWPMLVISTGMAVFDWLNNFQKNKTENALSVFGRKADKARETYSENEKTRKEDKEKLEFLKKVSQQYDVAIEDQQKSARYVNDLNSRYKDLNLSVDKNGRIVGDLTKSYDKMSDAQKKTRKKELENIVNLSLQEAQAFKKGFGARAYSGGTGTAKLILDGVLGKAQHAEILQAVNDATTLNQLENAYQRALSYGMQEAEYIKDIIDKMKEYEEAVKNLKNYDKEEEPKEVLNDFPKDLYDTLNKFRETSASAINAMSEESIRLQSRRFLTPERDVYKLQKEMNDYTKSMAKNIESINETREKDSSNIEKAATAVASLGVSTVG